jgi:Ca-activated chloride channel family protein
MTEPSVLLGAAFANPAALWLLLLVPLALGAYLIAQRRRTQYAARFTNLDLLASVVPKTPGWKRHVPPVLFLTALAVLVVGVARPQATQRVARDQATVVLVFDVSGSMKAEDVSPSRLGAAQAAATAMLDTLPARVQVGVVAFSTTVRVLATPTTDRGAVRQAIGGLQPLGGTALGDAIMEAIRLVRPDVGSIGPDGQLTPPTTTPGQKPPARAPASILLLSDGAQTVGTVQPLDAADVATQEGVPIYTVALGTPNGEALIPDERGILESIPVPPDPETLQAVSSRTNAQSFATASASTLKAVYRNLAAKFAYTKVRRDATHIYDAVALGLLLVGGALSLAWFSRFP